MKRKLFKRITAMALALLMVGTAIPSGSDFTGLFGSEITASAVRSQMFTSTLPTLTL